MRKYGSLSVFIFVVILAVSGVRGDEKKQEIKFYDVKAQSEEFIGYYNSIKLTPEQEKLKTDALSGLPAPCCSDQTMATCCCPCNHSKTVWGLSNYVISKLNYDKEKVRKTAADWIQYTHKNGSSGDACYKGKCNAPFHEDGCGGMKEDQLIF